MVTSEQCRLCGPVRARAISKLYVVSASQADQPRPAVKAQAKPDTDVQVKTALMTGGAVCLIHHALAREVVRRSWETQKISGTIKEKPKQEGYCHEFSKQESSFGQVIVDWRRSRTVRLLPSRPGAFSYRLADKCGAPGGWCADARQPRAGGGGARRGAAATAVTPAAPSRAHKAPLSRVLFNWAWHMGMLAEASKEYVT